MKNRVIFALLLTAVVATSVAAESASTAPPPCYVVIAVDISGGMQRADSPIGDGSARGVTLREDAQLVCMQFMPYLYSDLYIGVCHFSDRVRYALPEEETASLLNWSGTFLSEVTCRNMVRSPDFAGSYYVEIDRGLDWAMARIQAARRRHGDGPGKIILLSRGDPRDTARNLEAGDVLFDRATALAARNIRIYSVAINGASYRVGIEADDLSSGERTGEQMMTTLASLTDGKAYRVTPRVGVPDILMDIFEVGDPLGAPATVSRYDWATAIVGPVPALVRITPVTENGSAETRAWPLDDRLETDTGIRSSTVTSSQWQTTVLRRPESTAQIARTWEGLWEVPSPGEVRLYRIPSFLLQLASEPASPWWAHEEVRVASHVSDRHRGTSTVAGMESPGDLSMRLTAQSQMQDEPSPLDAGHWTVPSRQYESDPFTVRAFGLYEFRGELVHRVGDVDVSLLDATTDVLVHPPCIGLTMLDASGDSLGSLSQTSETLSIEVPGGQQVSFRVSPQGTFGAKPLSGVLHLEDLPQADWELRPDESGGLVTKPITLPEGEERVFGRVEVQVQTSAGTFPFRLPQFEVAYPHAPVRVACTFSEPRDALWTGELHRQLVTVTAFPVFAPDRERVLAMFPETLDGARVRTMDMTSGTAQVMTLRGRLVEVPKATGKDGRTLTATYALESDVPLPKADQCEISLEGTIESLQDAVKTYAVTDPVAAGSLRWSIDQQSNGGPSQGPAETIYCGEPVRFSAQWQSDQSISAVRFQIGRPQPDQPLDVKLPVGLNNRQASAEQSLPGLQTGQTYPVSVYVTVKSSADATPIEIKLRGGQFRARDRRLLLQELGVGDETGKDVACYPWEPVRIPLRIVFGGYIAGNTEHSTLIDRVKTSCHVTVTSPSGDTQDLSDAIEWTALVPSDTREGRATRCELKGYAPFVPLNTGRAAVEMTAEFAQDQEAASTQRAYGHLAIKEPRVVLTVERLTSSQPDSLFDSQAWAAGSGGVSPVTTQLSTRLGIAVRPVNWTASTPPSVTLRVLRRPSSDAPWTAAFSTADDLTAGATLTREVPVAENGRYAVELTGRDRQSGQVAFTLTTPTLLSIHPHEIVPVIAPASWITSGVRHWPFEYRVSIQKNGGATPQVSSMAFQFQLPSDQSMWRDGSVHAGGAGGADAVPLTLRSPELLPPLEDVKDGSVKFRLSSQGQELVQWEHPNVRVLPPVLERLALSNRAAGGEMTSTSGRIESDGSAALWARPVFRSAPELAGQWTRGVTTVYRWPASDEALAGKPPTGQWLAQAGAADGTPSSRQAFQIDEDNPAGAVEILPRLAPRGFWGLPRSAGTYRCAVVASTTYTRNDASDATIVEWTDIMFLDITTGKFVPWCWWVLAGIVAALLLVFVLKMLAPRPSKLGLDVRLEENVAVVQPASPASPVVIDLRTASLRGDIDLHVAHKVSRMNGGAGAAKPFIVLSASVAAIVRRAIYPRRWTWALITPRIGTEVDHVRTGLLGIWTSPFARRGRVWSSHGGLVQTPGRGQATSVMFELPYRMGGTKRSMRVSVRIRNVELQPQAQASEAQRPADSEVNI